MFLSTILAECAPDSAVDASLENRQIRWQRDSTLHAKITEIISRIQKLGSVGRVGEYFSEIERVVMEDTGISIRLDFDADGGENAYVFLVPVTHQHIFYGNDGDDGYLAASTRENLEADVVYGTFDLKSGKVGGGFSKLAHTMRITSGLLFDPEEYTAGECSAILLHEIGHAFTTMAATGLIDRTVHVLLEAAMDYEKADNDIAKIAILRKCADIAHLTEKEIQDIVKNGSTKSMVLLVAAKASGAVRETLGLKNYSDRECESLADQFAVRHGAGLDLASGLHKMYRKYSNRTVGERILDLSINVLIGMFFTILRYPSAIKYPLLVVAGILSSMWFAFVVTVAFILIFSIIFGYNNTYDDPLNRIRAIRREMIAGLRTAPLKPDERRQLLAHIDAVDRKLDELPKLGKLTDETTRFIYGTLMSGMNREMRSMRELESMLNNDLHLAHARLLDSQH
jgi:hypothetical protein